LVLRQSLHIRYDWMFDPAVLSTFPRLARCGGRSQLMRPVLHRVAS
jgi:hypothetical protein